MFIKTPQGIIIDVFVKPKSKEFRLELDKDKIMVLCHEVPMKGKVNKELLKQFSRIFNRKVELVSGKTSRQKKLLIRNIEIEEINRILVSASNLS